MQDLPVFEANPIDDSSKFTSAEKQISICLLNLVLDKIERLQVVKIKNADGSSTFGYLDLIFLTGMIDDDKFEETIADWKQLKQRKWDPNASIKEQILGKKQIAGHFAKCLESSFHLVRAYEGLKVTPTSPLHIADSSINCGAPTYR